MLGIKVKSGAVKRIEDIAWRNSRSGCINHGAFREIRNQELVRNTLLGLDYVPDCAAKPSVWRKKGMKRVAISNRDKIMPTESGRKILQTLLDTGVVHIADVPMTKAYLQNIIYYIKGLDHKIEPVKEGGLIIAYKLIEQA